MPLPDGVEKAPEWFPVGEVLNYKLYWGIMSVGKATISTDWVKVGDRTLLRIKATARTGRIVRMIYPVDDYVESLVDPVTMLPVQYRQELKEGWRRRRQDRIVFDHANKRAVWRDDKTDRSHVLIISEDTRDLMAFTYYMRGKDEDEKMTMTTDVIVDEKLYKLTIKGLKEEKIKIKGIKGKVPCFVVEPEAKFGEIFSKKGVVHIWCTKDERHLCAKLLAFLPFADFKAKISSFTREYGPVTDLEEVEVLFDLLERKDIPVYEADRDIYEQFIEQKKAEEQKLEIDEKTIEPDEE